MAETRYWKRVGMRLTRELAFEMESKMNAKGSYLDEDLEEFTAIDAESSDYKEELEALFSSPDEYAETGDPVDLGGGNLTGSLMPGLSSNLQTNSDGDLQVIESLNPSAFPPFSLLFFSRCESVRNATSSNRCSRRGRTPGRRNTARSTASRACGARP